MKKGLILFVALVALALVAWGLIRESSLEEQIMLPKLSFDESADRIDIAFEGKTITLVKDEKSWKVKEEDVLFHGDEAAIESVTKTLSDFAFQDLVSKNKDRYAVLGFEEVGVVSVTWFEGEKKKGVVYIGGQDYARGGDYAREGEDGPVYLTARPVRSIFALDSFKDLRLVSVSDAALVSKIAWEYPEASSGTTLVKKKQDAGAEEWVFENGATMPVNQDAAQTFVNFLAAFRAEDVKKYDAAAEYGFGEPALTMRIVMDGKEMVSVFGKAIEFAPEEQPNPNSTVYYVRVSGKDEWVYRASSSSVNELMKHRVDFEKKSESES